MPKIAKVLMMDRSVVKIDDEQYEELKEQYAGYCVDTWEYVNKIKGINSKEARDTIYGQILSPFQYFLEDKIRLKRVDDGKLTNPFEWTKK